MNVLLLISATVMVIMMYVGLHFVTEPNADSRIIGVCTLFWVGIAVYLLFTQWLMAKQQLSYGLVTITALSTVGYIVGRTITALLNHEPAMERERFR